MSDDRIDNLQVERPFPISCGIQLNIEISGIPYKLSSSIVGYIKNKYLIVNMPKAENVGLLRAKLFKGNRLIVRFLEDGTIYGFEADILGAIQDPAKLIIISYPKIVSRYELRGKKRYECFIPGELDLCENNYLAMILDLSEMGFRVALKAADNHLMPEVKVGEQVTFRFMMPGVDGKSELSGVVKNFQQDNQRIIMGISFIDFSDALKQTLQGYLTFLDDIKEAE